METKEGSSNYRVHIPTVDHSVDANSRTELLVRGMRFNVLVDTGAGPSCMARHVYTALGGDTDRLHKVGGRLTAANSSQLEVHGLSDPIQFDIKDNTISMRFFIIENLGADAIIMGRDFLKDYDVSVDVPNNKIEIRNPRRTYVLNTIHQINKKLPIRIAHSPAGISIDGGEMKKCSYDITHGRTSKLETEGNWLAMVEPAYCNRLDDKGMRIASSLSTVADGRCEVALLNVNEPHTEPATMNQKDSKVRLHPIWIEYRRVKKDPQIEMTKDQHVTVIDIRATKRPDEATLFEDERSAFTGLSLKSNDDTLSSRTNFPVETNGVNKQFPTKTKIEHLESSLTKKQ